VAFIHRRFMHRKPLTIDAIGSSLLTYVSHVYAVWSLFPVVFSRVLLCCAESGGTSDHFSVSCTMSSVLRRSPPNQSLQATAGRSEASLKIMITHLLQSA